MNILELQDTITKQYAHKVVEMTDSAAFAYVKSQLEYIQSIGANPSDYEVVFARDDFTSHTEDGLKITNRIRVERRKDIDNLPIVTSENDDV